MISEGTKTDITRIEMPWDCAMGWMEVSLVVRWSTNHSKPGVGDSITPSSVEFKIWPYRGLSKGSLA